MTTEKDKNTMIGDHKTGEKVKQSDCQINLGYEYCLKKKGKIAQVAIKMAAQNGGIFVYPDEAVRTLIDRYLAK